MPDNATPPAGVLSWLRVLGWTIPLAILMLLPWRHRLLDEYSGARFEVELQAGKAGMAQLFYERAGQYSEADSVKLSFPAGKPVTLRFPLPPGTYNQLRFDPTDRTDFVEIRSARIVDGSGGQAWAVDAAAMQPINDLQVLDTDNGRLYRIAATGIDPMFQFKPAAPLVLGSTTQTQVRLLEVLVYGCLGLGLAMGYQGLARYTNLLASSRRALTTLGLLLLVLGLPRLPSLGAPLLDAFEFRQTQTALSAYWMAQEGVSFAAYPLPVLGRPWTVPMEFPVFQIVCAGVYRAGIPLDMASRGLALFTFVLSVGLLLMLLHRLGASLRWLQACWLLAFISPFALVWSRAALIEFTATLFGLVYVALALAIKPGRPPAGITCALAVTGALAAVTKITTFTVFWPAVALLGAHHLFWEWRLRRHSLFPSLGAWIAALTLPLAVTILWTKQADAIKAASVATEWLTSEALHFWNFGSWAQRLDGANWATIGTRIRRDVLGEAWPLVLIGLPMVFRLPTKLRLICAGLAAGAVGTIATFFNLYVVHDYYLCAIVLPVWLLAALGLDGLAKLPLHRLWPQACLLALAVVLGFAVHRSATVARSYGVNGSDDILDIAAVIIGQTRPDDEIVILGEDWNPRLPYYARRKALMVKESRITAEWTVRYVQENRLRYVVATSAKVGQISQLWPKAQPLAETHGFVLYVLPPWSP